MSSIPLKTFLKPRDWYAWPALALMIIMSRTPNSILWFVRRVLGGVGFWFPTSNHRSAKRHIEVSIPVKSEANRMGPERKYFRLSGYATLSPLVAWFTPLLRVERFITTRDQHFLDKAQVNGRNVILLVPHLVVGSEREGEHIPSERKYVSGYRTCRDLLLEHLFLWRIRFGGVMVERMATLKSLLRLIRGGSPFYGLPDQDMGDRFGVIGPHFRMPAATVTIPNCIAKVTNAAVIRCITLILRKIVYEVRLYPPVENFPTAVPVVSAARMNREIEQRVREMPDQYKCSYRRFKTKPNNESSLI